MPDIESFLTKKIGPLPAWAWAAAGGGILSVVYLSQKGAAATSSTPAPTDTSGQNTGLFAPAPIIVTPGNMPSSTSSVTTPVPTTTTTPGLPVGMQSVIVTATASTQMNQKAGGTWARSGPDWNTPATRFIPIGQTLNTKQQPIRLPNGGPPGAFWFQTDSGDYVLVDDVQVQTSTGSGGGGSVVKMLPGSGGGKVLRHTSPHAHPQYLSLAGMGGGGHAHIAAISKQTKIPPLRIMALNPRMVRPGRRPNALHLR